MDLPTLRYLTQAGGRLAPEMVRKYGQWAHATGRRMFVMYGQTEAAPRMAYLPPDRLLANSDCIGIPVPGGTFQLVDERSEDHTYELQSLMRITYAVFGLKKKQNQHVHNGRSTDVIQHDP